MARLTPAILLVSRFGLVGIANTAIGYAVIAILDLGLKVAPPIANAAGYAIGFGISYLLNRKFVFRSVEKASATGPRYLVAAALAFALNQLVLALSTRVLGDGNLPHAASQLAGMAIYTVALFIACRVWVFSPD
jgi:putative flippase GtrA